MDRIITYIRQSLAAKLSFWVIVFVVLLFIAALGIMFHYSRMAVKEEAMEKASQTLENTLLRVENTLHDVEVAANNMKWLVEQHIDTPDSMFTFSRSILENNPNLNGCSIAFEPYYFEEKGQYFSAYSYNNGDSIETEQEGTDLYEYYYMDWYLIPKLLNRPYWVEPFREDSTSGIWMDDIITSFCQPIHDKWGQNIGVLSVDIALIWFSNTISETKPFPHSYSILLGAGGSFLIHPDTTKLFYQTIFTPTLEEPDTALTALGKAMISGETGYKILKRNGKNYYVFYRPFSHINWSVGIVCPEEDIFEPYNRLQQSLMLITAVGLILLLFFCITIIRYNLRPLKELARVAKHIAAGNFNDSVPDSRRRDEVGHLQHSFSMMQKSLGNYVAEIRQSTNTLQERNSELIRANQLAREDDRTKSAVINNMTDQMVDPVSIIAAENDIIRENYQNFSEKEMAEHVDRMLQETETVTGLLNKILDASQNGANAAWTDKARAAKRNGNNATLSNEENSAK